MLCRHPPDVHFYMNMVSVPCVATAFQAPDGVILMIQAGSRGPCRGYQPLTLYNAPKRTTVRFRSTSTVFLSQRNSGHAFRPMLAAPFRSALTQVPSADLYRPRRILFPENGCVSALPFFQTGILSRSMALALEV